MSEIIAAAVTTIDIIAVYAFIKVRKGRFLLALWTSFLNMLFPFIGFEAGELSTQIFTVWSSLLSGALLSFIGVQMILYDGNQVRKTIRLSPMIVALAVSVDAFSVSVSFGMMNMNKFLYIAASGMFALVFAYGALVFKTVFRIKTGNGLRLVGGIALILMGILSWVH